MKITNKVLFFRAFSVMLVFGLLFIGCGEYKPDIGAWIDGYLEKARKTTEESPANPEAEPDPTSPEPTSPKPAADPVAEVTEAADSQEMKTALETYAKELELDLTLYGMFSDDIKNATAQSVHASKPYADKEAIQTAFNAALQAAATAEEDLSKKFKITPEDITEKAAVEASFNAVHNYIQKIFDVDTTEAQSVIKLGDYIDLIPLTVVGDAGHTAEPDYGYINAKSDLRLIVIGINSFNAINDNNTPHVVFHFKDVPGRHKMNNSGDNTTGYYGSAMREYIRINFLTGLENAGVPDEVLWAPSRRVASRGDGAPTAQAITDKLWLPTAWEMFGEQKLSVASCETSSNQVSFTGYYEDDDKRKKTADWYWLASPHSTSSSASNFCFVYNSGCSFYTANTVGGFAPAFCVK